MSKGQIITFKADEEYLGMLDKLAEVLCLDRSKTIRVALDDAIAKYGTPGYQGDLVVIDPKALGKILTAHMDRVRMLERELEREKFLSAFDVAERPKMESHYEHQEIMREVLRKKGEAEAGRVNREYNRIGEKEGWDSARDYLRRYRAEMEA